MVALRVIIGIAMMIGGCVGIYWSVREEGLGCFGAIASAIACFVIVITMQVIPASELRTFWGMDYITLSEIAGVLILFCIIFAETHFAGIIGCFVLFFTGLLVTGLLDAATVSMLSEYVGGAGFIVFAPMLIPLGLLVVCIAII